jgi:electron transport complex protein RnfA
VSALAALAVFSGLSLNLLLQFGLGIRELVDLAGSGSISPAYKRDWGGIASPGWIVVFVTALALWFFFSYALIPPAFGFLESFLLLPSTLLVSTALNLVFAYFFPGGKVTLQAAARLERPSFAFRRLIKSAGLAGGLLSGSSCNGLALVSLFMALRLAITPAEALALTLGFSLGALLAALILREISRRSSLEATPETFRGAPLTLISMGLLSLIFASVAAILLRVLGVL